MDTWRLWPIRVVLWALTMALVLWPFMLAAELAVEKFVASMVHNLEIVRPLVRQKRIDAAAPARMVRRAPDG